MCEAPESSEYSDDNRAQSSHTSSESSGDTPRVSQSHPRLLGFCNDHASEQMCWPVQEVCCTQAGVVTTEVWQYVGEKAGAYEAEKSFRFVGCGMGNWSRKLVTLPYGLRPRVCTIATLCIVLLGFAAWLVWQILAKSNGLALHQQQGMQYDCSAEHIHAVNFWSTAQKQWCCEHGDYHVLAKICPQDPGNGSRKQSLRQLAEGKLPATVRKWPDDPD
jgi:hypothetical protein